jgi:hypothetical protein
MSVWLATSGFYRRVPNYRERPGRAGRGGVERSEWDGLWNRRDRAEVRVDILA